MTKSNKNTGEYLDKVNTRCDEKHGNEVALCQRPGVGLLGSYPVPIFRAILMLWFIIHIFGHAK